MSICGSGMLTRSLALLADHLAVGDVLRQVALHLAADDLAEALVIAFDLLAHGNPTPYSPLMRLSIQVRGFA